MTVSQIPLGFETGTGKPVAVPLGHLAVTGQTQLSGKTTTLEALVSRSGLRAVAFVTKRGEGSFRHAPQPLAPYFRERADWQFVQSLLEATMRQRLKFETAWIIQVARGARTLADVKVNIERRLEKAKSGLNRNVLECLNAYFELVLPQIERLPYTKELRLAPGLNVMDLSGYEFQMQALVIRSVLEWVYANERETVVVIPEAWEFCPQDRGSPVRLAAEELIRKGAALRNFIWLDSQDLAGVHKVLLRAVSVWVIGVQREANEITRTLKQFISRPARPKPDEIMTLGRGEFFVCHGQQQRRVYVQPAWLSAEHARAVALGEETVESVAQIERSRFASPRSEKPEDDEMLWRERYEEEKKKNQQLDAQLAELRRQVDALKDELRAAAKRRATEPPAAPSIVPPASAADLEGFYSYVRDRLLADPQVLAVAAEKKEIVVRVDRPRVEVDGNKPLGAIARLIAEGFFREPRNAHAVFVELVHRQKKRFAKPTIYREVAGLAEMGFLRCDEQKQYREVEGMRVRLDE